MSGWQCAVFALTSWPHDDQISSLALCGGWLNPQVLLLFFLTVFCAAPSLRALLTVTILFSISMTWIAIHRMSAAGMYMDLKAGHFLWIAGIVLILLSTLPLAFAIPFLRCLAAAAAGVIALLAVPLLIALTMHPASEKDDFLYVVAWTLKEPALCGRIDAGAIGRRDQYASRDFTYMQSNCYRNVAAMIHAPQLCDNVKSAGADRLIGSLVAKSDCRKQNSTLGSAMPSSGPHFVRAMQLFGFSDEYLAQIRYEGRPDIYLYPILNALRAHPSFLPRLQALPGYAEPSAPRGLREPQPLEFLYEIVAIQMDLPALCQKVSPNARPRAPSLYTFPLQAICLANVAFNRRDNALCRNLPSATNVWEANESGFLEGCMKNVAVLRNPDSHLQWARYGPGGFPTWPQFQEAVQELGYPTDTGWLRLPRPTPQDYENYLWGLASPEHQSARDEFVRRILATR